MTPHHPLVTRLRQLPGKASITSRLTLVLLSVGLVPLLAGQWMALEQFKRTLVLDHLEQTDQIAEGKEEELEVLLKGKSTHAETPAEAKALTTPQVQQILDSHLLGLGKSARTDLVRIQRQGRELRMIPMQPGESALSDPSFQFHPLTSRPLESRVLGSTPEQAGTFHDPTGEQRIGSWRRLKRGDLALLVSLERQEVLQSARDLRTKLLSLVLLTTAAVSTAGVLLGRSLTRPLLDLHAAVRGFDMANDGLLRPVRVSGNDEISELATTINRMVQGIQERTASLNRTNNRIQAYIQTVQTALLAIDHHGDITLLNAAGCGLLGFAPASWLGRNWIRDHVVEEEAKRQLAAALSALGTAGQSGPDIGEAAMLEYHVRTQDGRVLLMRWHSSLLRGETGDVIGILSSGEDITRSRSQELELIEARRVAEEANAAKSEFLSRMSHELRTPMNAIIGMSHLALRADPEPRLKDYISKINAAGQKLLAIINDILDFSKIEAGKMSVERTDFLLDTVLADLTSLIAQKIFDKGLELLFLVDEDVPRQLVGDPLRLGQVLLNLLSNSNKFTQLGQILLHIRCLERQGQRVRLGFEVSDTGIGISEAQLATLFQPFEQAELSTTRHYGGSGLGLTICRHLLGLMEGTIEARSQMGAGTTFLATAWLGLGKEPPSPVLPSRLNNLSVLLVDDNPIAIAVLEANLAHLSIRLSACGSGQDTLERVRTAAAAGEPIDLLLLDWQLPDIDGLEIVRRLRAREGIAMPKVVMVTAYGKAEIRQEAEGLGIQAFLTKPVCQSDLLDTLIALLEPSSASPRPHADLRDDLMGVALAGLRVLLVEDNQVNQQICTELLGSVGVVVTVAENGEEALRRLGAKDAGTPGGDLPFDLVLMDLNMPVLDGWEATRQLRRNPRFDGLPVLAMTAHALVEERERCLALGMQEHLTKPIEPARLYGALARWGKRPLEQARGAAQAPRPAPGATPHLNGFDQAGALRRTAGNVTLYHQLLASLARTQADAADRVAEALQTDNTTTARQIIHTVKGVAANLGATALAEAASRLENTLQIGQGFDDDLAEFHHSLDATVAQIQALPPGAANQPRPNSGPPIARAEEPERRPIESLAEAGSTGLAIDTPTADLVSRLKALLVAGEGEAIDFFHSHRERLGQGLGAATVAAIEAQLHSFEFEAAVASLQATAPPGTHGALPGSGGPA